MIDDWYVFCCCIVNQSVDWFDLWQWVIDVYWFVYEVKIGVVICCCWYGFFVIDGNQLLGNFLLFKEYGKIVWIFSGGVVEDGDWLYGDDNDWKIDELFYVFGFVVMFVFLVGCCIGCGIGWCDGQ